MAIKVKTTHGKAFRRCGLTFGPEWTRVDDKKLNKPFGSPKPTKKSPTIGEILKADKMLVAVPAESVAEEPDDGEQKGRGRPGK